MGVLPPSSQILGDTAAAVGTSHDGCVATAVLGAPVVAALGRHRSTAGTPKLAVKKTCGDAENMLTKWHSHLIMQHQERYPDSAICELTRTRLA